MASIASFATTCGARKHAWTKIQITTAISIMVADQTDMQAMRTRAIKFLIGLISIEL